MIELDPLGDRAFLARFATEAEAAAWSSAVRSAGFLGVLDVVTAYQTAAVFADPDRVDLGRLESDLRAIDSFDASTSEGRLVRVPVLYDGEDLRELSSRLGLRVEEIVTIHSGCDYRVFAIGFQPGFPYAGYLPDALSGLARREPPRVRVLAGSVALVGRQTGIYPSESPGGWHLVGRTPLSIVDFEQGRFPIRAGDRLRFVPIDEAQFESQRGEPLLMNASGRIIDLNADLGEGFPHDEALLERVTSASIACGAHAGDRETILRTLEAARLRGVCVGAHPGYADRESFGRREQSLSALEVERLVFEQVTDLGVLAAEVGVPLRFVKPHGALYNQAQSSADTAAGVVAALWRLRLPLLGQPHSILPTLASDRGVPFVGEGFPDRRYQSNGRLVPRSEPDAILSDPGEMEAQAIRLAEQGVGTLCIHGDDPRAVENADRVRSVLLQHRFVLQSFA